MRLDELEDNQSYEHFVETIKADCQPYLNMVQQSKCVLVRGMVEFDGYFVYDMPVKRYREHTTVNPFLSKLMAKDGFKATRSNSVFCFSAEISNISERAKNVKDFGDMHVVFPKGNFDMTWLEPFEGADLYYHDDLGGNGWYNDGYRLYLSDSPLIDKVKRMFKHKKGEEIPTEGVAAAFWAERKKQFHNTLDLNGAANAAGEVMIHSNDSYHAVHHSVWDKVRGLL